ncbi:MAG: hypothetical protein KF908_13495 [Nitrosomonas sp.]|nr:hypothetical protein [Nitrosomonas sp.]MBX3640374.1 hypothetical protein [Nitrosomonas sp.]MCW5607235.1 hypothetical protein [Nitrosomonas sp.]MCW5617654.1 hypothetical protein [Nitrosomonas sp.]
MNVNKLIITTFSSIAILGLIGCKKEDDKPVTNILAYASKAEQSEPIQKINDLPKEFEETLSKLGIKAGIVPIIDHESGDIFIFKSRDAEIKDLKFPISTQEIKSVTPITVFRFEGSKCTGISLGGSGAIVCTHIRH